jgi:hypothetical protein
MMRLMWKARERGLLPPVELLRERFNYDPARSADNHIAVEEQAHCRQEWGGQRPGRGGVGRVPPADRRYPVEFTF